MTIVSTNMVPQTVHKNNSLNLSRKLMSEGLTLASQNRVSGHSGVDGGVAVLFRCYGINRIRCNVSLLACSLQKSFRCVYVSVFISVGPRGTSNVQTYHGV